jgi:hypothetical protein
MIGGSAALSLRRTSQRSAQPVIACGVVESTPAALFW